MNYDPNIWIGIAIIFLTTFLNVGITLVAFKVLHHVFEWEDAWERPMRRAQFRNDHNID